MDFTMPEHLSYSTITSFISSRFDWFQRKIIGKPWEGNIHTERGNAVEHGLDLMIDGKSLSDCKDAACDMYDRACKGMEGYDVALLKSIRDVLDKLSEEFPYQDVAEKQKKVIIDIGLELPILGFLDYRMNARLNNEIRDLKSTTRKPSKLSQNYRIQGGMYQKWGGDCRMIYCFGIHTKTASYHEIELDLNDGQKMVEYAQIAGRAIIAIYKMMSKPVSFWTEQDKENLFKMLLFPDLDAAWNPKDYKQAADWIGLRAGLFQ